MKIIKHFSFALIAIALFTFAASAQLPSLADVGDDVYHSDADGFEIALPDGCVSPRQTDIGRSYVCEVKEGSVSVSITRGDTPVKSDTDVAAFIQGFRGVLAKDAGVKLVGETSAKIGDYRGAAFQIILDGDKVMMVALVWDKFTVVITGRANGKVANSAELIQNAVTSFEFVSPESK